MRVVSQAQTLGPRPGKPTWHLGPARHCTAARARRDAAFSAQPCSCTVHTDPLILIAHTIAHKCQPLSGHQPQHTRKHARRSLSSSLCRHASVSELRCSSRFVSPMTKREPCCELPSMPDGHARRASSALSHVSDDRRRALPAAHTDASASRPSSRLLRRRALSRSPSVPGRGRGYM